ncbi:MFS family permease [Novosphingobium hassiacum]|uniref:MFS family permease n=1 Tax=Novosphingobium hassiacum TaxID=173676 RepID=A0A7W6EW64_9SPHN|nr:MFS transporter [Novosphingobium hassiacum]MBB3860911.1 MFS family permease [Novosphingobium hassiacum]
MSRTASILLMCALFVVEVTAAFETAMIYAASGQLIKAFGDPIAVGWLITVYLLVGAAAAAIIARLGDIYGRRRVSLVLMAVIACGSLLSALSSSFLLILIGRGLQGISSAILPLCFGMARENMQPTKVPLAVGVIMSGASAGSAAGLVIGGSIVDNFGWQAIFYASAGMATLSFALLLLFVPRSTAQKGPRAKLDVGSALLFVPGLLAILIAISEGKDWGWTSPTVLGLLAGGLALIVIWIRRSLKHADPLIDVRLFANRNVAIANASYGLIALGGLQMTLVFSIMMQAPVWTGIGLGLSAAVAGLVKLPANVLAFFAGPLSGYSTTRLGGRAVMAGGGMLSALGWVFVLIFHDNVWQIGLSFCIITLGTAILYAAGPNVVISAVPPDRTSEATGMLAVVRSIAMGVGSQLIAVLLATSTISQQGTRGTYPDAHAFMLTVVVIMCLTLSAALISLLLPRRAGLPNLT